MTATTSKVRTSVQLTGRPDPNPSRWLWLVKMFLAVPHYVVLAFLWIAFLVATVGAGCQVLVTGRYPRALFDFNLGVLRWNWRVGFYVYAALGTDRYPPFTLAPVADYPATLDLPYPERLPRGLTLVRSRLVAAPHLLIVFLIAGVLLPYPWTDVAAWTPGLEPVGGYSILNVLVVVAGSFLLITGRYPLTLFDLLLGINRWLYRVLTYSTFMATAYPPFRLDQGTYEPHDNTAETGAFDEPSDRQSHRGAGQRSRHQRRGTVPRRLWQSSRRHRLIRGSVHQATSPRSSLPPSSSSFYLLPVPNLSGMR